MRPIEAVLSVANVVGFVVLVLPRLRRRHRVLLLLTVPVVVAVAQILAEGFRWQVAPAYALASGLPGAWLARRATSGRLRIRRCIACTATIAGLAGCAIVLVVSVALPVAVPVFHFPVPTGRYGIGTVTYVHGGLLRPGAARPDVAAAERSLAADPRGDRRHPPALARVLTGCSPTKLLAPRSGRSVVVTRSRATVRPYAHHAGTARPAGARCRPE